MDGTLLIRGKLNQKLADWIQAKQLKGFETLLWSAQGKDHAQKVAERFEITGHFSAIISKPGFIVDDKSWSWIKFTKRITRLD